jgi:hypothetical protein
MRLNELFESIPDFRRGQGQRYKLADVLWLVFLGIASGYSSYRSLAKFAQANRDYFVGQLALKHGVPSHVTIREILTQLDKQSFLEHFNQWAASQELQAGDWLSGDGKSLASTVSAPFEEEQNFSAMVSLFAQRTGLTFQIADYRNKETSEAEILRSLLPSLQDKEVVLTLDALHLQKKR